MIYFSLLIVFTFFSWRWYDDDSYNGFAFGAALFISSVLLVVSLIMLPINYYNVKAEIQSYYALKDTIEVSRENGNSEIERAALVQKIADNNTRLANLKYWNGTILDIFIPDEIENLDPLK